jgi:hypothetical protein
MNDINTICLPGPGQSLAIAAPVETVADLTLWDLGHEAHDSGDGALESLPAPVQVIYGLTDAQCRVVAELPPQLPHAQRWAVIQAFRRLNEG